MDTDTAKQNFCDTALDQEKIIRLSFRDWEFLINKLANPSPPTAALEKAMERHQRLIQTDDL
ncbi:hypothetical protein AGMMS49545_14610 [Betaproteobacteria bacterium]|nr:hypothetical protein AGMMS49545_14610 [Betaproteobacteria bacterium]GHU41616.1 hypothetical protein AGMMS50289_05050 [Betaproteobacteria bacterium]